VTLSLNALVFGYVVLALGGLCAVGIFYERRRKSFEPEPTEDHIFRCTRCSYVYTDDPDVDRSRCPHCATPNEPVEF